MRLEAARKSGLAMAALLLGSCASTEQRFCKTVEDPEIRIPLSIRLADETHGVGRNLSFTPWKIVAGDTAPTGLYSLQGGTTLGEGKTGTDGLVALDATQQHALAVAHCAQQALWLVYSGQTRQLELHLSKPGAARCGVAKGQTLCIDYMVDQ